MHFLWWDINHMDFFGFSMDRILSLFQKGLYTIVSQLEPNGRTTMSFHNVIINYGLLESEHNM